MSLEKKDFAAKILADSVNPNGNRVTSFILTYPRFIHSELMTHRVFSRNAASSRAIPISKIIEQVVLNTAAPCRWGKNGKGMQDHGELEVPELAVARKSWEFARDQAVMSAKRLEADGLHKQIVNRVLEPYMWMTTLVTATEWENFYSLRLHKDAQPEFQKLAHIMLKEYVRSVPKFTNWGDWHIPYGDKMPEGLDLETKLKIATARAARTSYLTMDGEISIDKDILLHDSLSKNGHWSPFEQSCQADEKGRSNFIGWKQYRQTFSNENRKCNLQQLLKNYEDSIKQD
jgi:thymidylate synthase ThyX